MTAPRANWGKAWTELTGYVIQARDDGEPLDPEVLLAYMQELKTRALEPISQWLQDMKT